MNTKSPLMRSTRFLFSAGVVRLWLMKPTLEYMHLLFSHHCNPPLCVLFTIIQASTQDQGLISYPGPFYLTDHSRLTWVTTVLTKISFIQFTLKKWRKEFCSMLNNNARRRLQRCEKPNSMTYNYIRIYHL